MTAYCDPVGISRFAASMKAVEIPAPEAPSRSFTSFAVACAFRVRCPRSIRAPGNSTAITTRTTARITRGRSDGCWPTVVRTGVSVARAPHDRLTGSHRSRPRAPVRRRRSLLSAPAVCHCLSRNTLAAGGHADDRCALVEEAELVVRDGPGPTGRSPQRPREPRQLLRELDVRPHSCTTRGSRGAQAGDRRRLPVRAHRISAARRTPRRTREREEEQRQQEHATALRLFTTPSPSAMPERRNEASEPTSTTSQAAPKVLDRLAHEDPCDIGSMAGVGGGEHDNAHAPRPQREPGPTEPELAVRSLPPCR